MTTSGRPLAVVTGASRGIGLELARQFAANGFDLILDAEDADVDAAAADLRRDGAEATAVQADQSTPEGVVALHAAIRDAGRPVDALAINAGIGTSGPFVDGDLADHLRLIDLNVRGAVHLAGLVVPAMAARGEGRVLLTASIASTMPGPYQSTYAASKAFLYSFAQAIRHELRDRGVTVTALMPGPTDTDFFERAGLEDTKVGQGSKDDPAEVARDGYEALMAGKDHVVAGSVRNKAMTAAAKVMPDKAAAAMHGAMSKPGSAPGSGGEADEPDDG